MNELPIDARFRDSDTGELIANCLVCNKELVKSQSEYFDFVRVKWKYMKHYSSRKENQPDRYIDLNNPDNEMEKNLR
mgnify:CR=1 FL=1